MPVSVGGQGESRMPSDVPISYIHMIGLYRRTLCVVLPAFVIPEQICYLPISLSHRELIRGSALVIQDTNIRAAFE
jgi:hypothetical protein